MPHSKKRVAFIRHYQSYTGGHQKVRDYIDHFIALGWEVELYLVASSHVREDLFNCIPGVTYNQKHSPERADLVFLAGLDWQTHLLTPSATPVLNLIQHVRHALPNDERFPFLFNDATRICVSLAVLNAVTPLAKGKCHWVRMGHTIASLDTKKENDLYILATKAPELGHKVANWACHKGWKVILHSLPQSPNTVHKMMASSKVTLALPHNMEGFYLPGIEAMYYSDAAVLPDCIANREYCKPGSNAIVCEYQQDAIEEAISLAFKQIAQARHAWRKRYARIIVSKYSLQQERQALKRLLTNFTR